MRRLHSFHQVVVLGCLGAALSGCGSAELATQLPDEDPGANQTGGSKADATTGGFMINQDASAPADGSVGQAGSPSNDEAGLGIGMCGDGIQQPGEGCDDGNAVPGDGCDGVCALESGYSCPVPGQACSYGGVVAVCGDSKIDPPEGCDDGNTVAGDGCSATCDVESGWGCAVAGQPCTHVNGAACGDGTINTNEKCDDHNLVDGDGCSATCTLEPGWKCSQPGQPCLKVEFCGDGVVQPSLNEQCDDGNSVPGDGCSGICKIDPGYVCGDGGACMRIWICGNGKVDPGEACDDSNTVGGDGCAPDCTYVEPGYTCPKALDGTGGACTQVPQNTCGDAVLGGVEQCDDGNVTSNDGCTANCAIEPGYTCTTVGMACTQIAFCGDGIQNLAEECDDHNKVSGDGCSAQCSVEQNFACPNQGQPCVSTIVCGNGIISPGGAEECDDHNLTNNDGCDDKCKREPGWFCPTANAPCVPVCGDGKIVGGEQCDDGNLLSNDGCSATCKLEPSFACVTGGAGASVCHATVCGDGVKEGSEQCDDGARVPYDGCSPSCTIEPRCANGQCTAVCGDGFKFASETCDDGNNFSGDGCSADCSTIETGFDCSVVTLAPPDVLMIPILYRDFLGRDKGPITVDGGVIAQGHPDFELNPYNFSTGLLQSTLGADGKPVFKSSKGDANNNPDLQDATSFYWWYHDQLCGADGGACSSNPYGKPVYLDAANNPTTLTFNKVSGGAGPVVYQFDSSSFFPLDNLGWNASPLTSDVRNGHNFHFTSELRYQFTYKGGEKLDFTGDDDVWVYINGHIAVDLGGIHGATNGSITLDAATVASKGLGLVVDGMYEIALFQAERHTTESNYKLSLSGFVHALTQCVPHCGDAKLEGDEVCDDGINDGLYGHCLPGCHGRAGYCGDGVTQTPPEECDNGTNSATYGGTTAQCGPGCKIAPYCGDGKVSGTEQCDEGAANGTGYGHCTAACLIGPKCGDGHVDLPQEACDDGINNGSSGDKCSTDCKLKCGNGVKDPGEQCDDGAANANGYGKCSPSCVLGPRCGDGIQNGTEKCDDGKNDGSYGTCNPDCSLANYCGDNVLTNPPETCDQGGQNSSTAYGKNLCDKECKPAPYCGDKEVDGAFNEVCDDGVNSGLPGSCTVDCHGFVPLSSCGDGVVQPPEQCDPKTRDGGTDSTCDSHCRFRCGNGVKEAGEDCDNGVNNGSYGTCGPTCKFSGYCGDGTQQGPEQCDKGTANNVDNATAYGKNVCTSVCVWAPYCGDGRIHAPEEECDGTANCDVNCKLTMIQ